MYKTSYMYNEAFHLNIPPSDYRSGVDQYYEPLFEKKLIQAIQALRFLFWGWDRAI